MNCWHRMDTCPKVKDDQEHPVLVWHVYQMCMVYDPGKALENRFVVRWREIPDEWIPVGERLPDCRDANVLGVVIVKDIHGEIRLRGWRLVRMDETITHWMPTPDAPDDYLELREAAEKPKAQERKKDYGISQHQNKRDQRH